VLADLADSTLANHNDLRMLRMFNDNATADELTMPAAAAGPRAATAS